MQPSKRDNIHARFDESCEVLYSTKWCMLVFRMLSRLASSQTPNFHYIINCKVYWILSDIFWIFVGKRFTALFDRCPTSSIYWSDCCSISPRAIINSWASYCIAIVISTTSMGWCSLTLFPKEHPCPILSIHGRHFVQFRKTCEGCGSVTPNHSRHQPSLLAE